LKQEWVKRVVRWTNEEGPKRPKSERVAEGKYFKFKRFNHNKKQDLAYNLFSLVLQNFAASNRNRKMKNLQLQVPLGDTSASPFDSRV